MNIRIHPPPFRYCYCRFFENSAIMLLLSVHRSACCGEPDVSPMRRARCRCVTQHSLMPRVILTSAAILCANAFGAHRENNELGFLDLLLLVPLPGAVPGPLERGPVDCGPCWTVCRPSGREPTHCGSVIPLFFFVFFWGNSSN